jgi:hypothetical protein
MSSRKRNRQTASSAAVEDGQCTIKLADASLPADLAALRVFSSCARGLPVDAQEWDLSGLQVDGQSVSRATVEAWLACVDSVVAGSPLDLISTPLLKTAKGLQQLLLFADAVGSVGGVLNACLSGLEDLYMPMEVGSETVNLYMCNSAAGYRVDEEVPGKLVLCSATLLDNTWGEIGTFSCEDQEVEFCQQVASQTAALLYVGHRLQLPQLLQTLHSFVFRCHVLPDGIFNAYVPEVFTERVLAAAVGSNQLSRDTYVTSVLTQPCSAHGGVGLHQLLRSVQNPQFCSSRRELCWDAQLAEDFFGCVEGSELYVQLDMLGPRAPAIRFGEDGPWLRAQILLGHGIFNEQTRDEYRGDESSE